jgi:pimeloyl-ACP methyl ester carboxylesterase
VFARPLTALGVDLVAPGPPPGGELARGYLTLLDTLANERGVPILVGGISFGAHLAAEWAVRNPGRCAGLLAALPAWNGLPGQAPASLAAKLSADLVARDGVEPALAASIEGVPGWLADELSRAWRRHGDGLAESLRVAAGHPAPTLEALAALGVPAGIATCVDDPIHPAELAHAWASALPRASVCETSLAAMGADHESLGRATVLAWLRARSAAR